MAQITITVSDAYAAKALEAFGSVLETRAAAKACLAVEIRRILEERIDAEEAVAVVAANSIRGTNVRTRLALLESELL